MWAYWDEDGPNVLSFAIEDELEKNACNLLDFGNSYFYFQGAIRSSEVAVRNLAGVCI